jgi:NAD(P)-dependent dehydrogenase (short-subunit alcohol dehydrogenase family)
LFVYTYHRPIVTMATSNPYAVNPQPFAGKVITITGASRGVGLALSKYLLARGATVSGCATSEANLAKAAKEIATEFPEAKDHFFTRVVDIENPAAVRSWMDETVAKFGKPDGCANVAGAYASGHAKSDCQGIC